MHIVIGTRRWSTWSLRPWLVLKRTGAPFTETLVPLRRTDTAARMAAHSPSALAPVLKDGPVVVWDSLAVCEYLNEAFPEARLWPKDRERRALGRSAAAEMHSGFQSLRGECPMDLTAAPHPLTLSEATAANVRRLTALWSDLRGRYGADGPFLLGPWSIADAFFTPVATRVRTYGMDLSAYGDTGVAAAYVEALLKTPEFLDWERLAIEEAAAEPKPD